MIAVQSVSVPGRLSGVSVDANPGEVLAILGPNGAGKSTLLAVMAGSLRASTGTVRIDAVPVRAWSRAKLAQRRAVVAQSVPPPFPLTVQEVVALGRIPHGDERVAGTIVAVSLAEVGLADHAFRSYPTLSGGERQRVQVARALAQVYGVQSSILLLDEPNAAADVAWQERLLALLRQKSRAGATIVVVLHDLNLACRWADRAVVLHDGQTVGSGTPGAALDGPHVSAAWDIPFLRGQAGPFPVLFPALEPS